MVCGAGTPKAQCPNNGDSNEEEMQIIVHRDMISGYMGILQLVSNVG